MNIKPSVNLSELNANSGHPLNSILNNGYRLEMARQWFKYKKDFLM